MSRALAGGYGVVVTVNTGITGLAVIKRQQSWAPGRVAVAQLAGIAGLWMGTTLTRGHAVAVMTTGAEARCRGFIVGKRHGWR